MNHFTDMWWAELLERSQRFDRISNFELRMSCLGSQHCPWHARGVRLGFTTEETEIWHKHYFEILN